MLGHIFGFEPVIVRIGMSWNRDHILLFYVHKVQTYLKIYKDTQYMVSLRSIGTFVESNGLFSNTEQDGIQQYLKDAEHGYFWLKGQKIKHIDDPITMEEMDQVIEMDQRRKWAYGFANTWEQSSSETHDYKFTQLHSVLRQMNTTASMSTKVPAEN